MQKWQYEHDETQTIEYLENPQLDFDSWPLYWKVRDNRIEWHQGQPSQLPPIRPPDGDKDSVLWLKAADPFPVKPSLTYYTWLETWLRGFTMLQPTLDYLFMVALSDETQLLMTKTTEVRHILWLLIEKEKFVVDGFWLLVRWVDDDV